MKPAFIYGILVILLLAICHDPKLQVEITESVKPSDAIDNTSRKYELVELTKKLYSAAQTGDEDEVHQVLQQKGDLTYEEILGETVIQSMTTPNEALIVKTLLSYDLNIDFTDENGLTPPSRRFSHYSQCCSTPCRTWRRC